jgi:3D-(3,5/4)-trihydroxycyclohexane-1,2-dione acylhydrolase (decyclizing)
MQPRWLSFVEAVTNIVVGYQSIHGHQKALVGHSLGNEFKVRDTQSRLLDDGSFIEVDYVKNAESVGVKAWLAKDESELRAALTKAKSEEGACMIVVPTEKYRFPPGSGVWWEVVGAEVTNDLKTRELVAAREAGRVRQRFYY